MIFRDVLAFDDVRGGAQIVDAGVGAGADEDAVDVDVNDGVPGFSPMYSRARSVAFCWSGSVKSRDRERERLRR